ncbi:Na+/H+ antiporter family protein [Roseimaritima multifibrata]|uniref:Na+/H+ antiporter family protein n=1 Tax=Roseimaritima multifibrata TaxID=1930274 RepID=A0A517MN37_9BACT|nr:Na+/H+ antiporter NhaC family protein [Roseimaritima multifibrata]QDS96197.1 Na+/H+ antiporter family protein [Roseimaritima multifibrata]
MTFGILSLLPSAIAILLAIITRRVLASLGIAVVVGALLLAWRLPVSPEPFGEGSMLPEAFRGSFPLRSLGYLGSHLYFSVFDFDHIRVLVFSLLLGGMTGVLEASQSMRAVMQTLAARIRGRKGGQSLIAGMGLAIFFDDYANTLLLGGTMRRVSDKLRISRAKLAYLVDSTAAPVAGLAVVSTWVATEISLIGEGIPEGVDVTAFSLFLQSIAYRFYPVFALILVLVIARTGRDFGPMLAAEREAVRGIPAGENASNDQPDSDAILPPARGWQWISAVLPVVLCVFAVGWSLYQTGTATLLESGDRIPPGVEGWGLIIGNADSYNALVIGGATGLLAAVLLGWMADFTFAGLRTLGIGILRGAWQIMPAMFVLWLAWALSAMADEGHLDAGGYLKNQISDRLAEWALPTVVFLVAALVAFSTGTSWGTMALLTPLAVQLGFQVSGGAEVNASVLAATGAVLAGSIMGDHCSPISDTTVLSSRACGCDHVQHVRTQMPYSLLAGGVAVGAGTLPAAMGMSPWIGMVIGAAALYGVVRFCGQDVSLLAVEEEMS